MIPSPEIWRMLFLYQTHQLAHVACDEFHSGLAALGLDEHGPPSLYQIDERLERLARWRLEAVDGILPASQFFTLLAQRRFPLIIHLRSPSELFWATEPDLFHDVLGHIPLLCHAEVGALYVAVARAWLAAWAEHDAERMRNLEAIWWYTAEFGMVRDGRGNARIWGAGILASPLGLTIATRGAAGCPTLDFTAAAAQSYDADAVQEALWCATSLSDLPRQFDEWSGSNAFVPNDS